MGAFYFRPHNNRYIVADQATKRMSNFAHALCLYIGPSVKHQAKQILQKWSEHKMSEKQNSSPYFPPLSGKVECGQCKDTECRCLGKHQRSRRDFTHTTGRCPRLPDQRSFVDEKEQKPTWKFCHICGEAIEYERTKPVQWAELNCERCGGNLIMEIQDEPKSQYIASSNYIGGSICRCCMEEHCAQTNCLQCEVGKQPDCPYTRIKKKALDLSANME